MMRTASATPMARTRTRFPNSLTMADSPLLHLSVRVRNGYAEGGGVCKRRRPITHACEPYSRCDKPRSRTAPASFSARPPDPRRSPMPFQLPDLPYAKDALVPHMSAETLEFHHGKHHKAYVTKTNELLEQEANLSGASLIEVIRGAKSSGHAQLFNNSAQLWNHSFFWQCLA